MYVCICNNVTDSQIKAAAAEGATSMRDVHEKLSVGSTCGKCTRIARQVLKGAMKAADNELFYQA